MNKLKSILLILLLAGCSKQDPGIIPTPPPVMDVDPGLTQTAISNCKLPEMLVRGDVGIGFPKIVNRLKSSGSVRVDVIFVDFSDAPAVQTTQEIYKSITPMSEKYLSSSSYGKLNVQLVPHYKWYRMGKTSTSYGWTNLTFVAHRQYLQEVMSLADPEIDFSGSDAFIVVASPTATAIWNGPAFTASPGSGIKADGKEFLSSATSGADLQSWRGYWFPHEFGHMMSLVDLYAYGTTSGHGFVGEWSIMGKISGKGKDLFGWEKWILGWLDDSQIVCVNSGANRATLTPLETTGGVKLFVSPISPTSALEVESRQALALDTLVPKSGPLVYLVDTGIPSGKGTIKVLPLGEGDQEKMYNTLSLGQEIAWGNLTVKYVAKNSLGDVIDIKRK